MLESSFILVLAVALAAAAIAFFGLEQLATSKWGRRGLVLAAVLVPIAASTATLKAGMEESSRTRFCLSCHEMEEYGRSLFVDNRKSLPAVHYQDRLVSRDSACYSCHTDYALFGDIKAKLNGLKHVWVHYIGTVPEKIELYQPYPNYNCLHCHDDARGYLEAPAHKSVQALLRSGELSCLKCHAIGHDRTGVAAGRFWQAE